MRLLNCQTEQPTIMFHANYLKMTDLLSIDSTRQKYSLQTMNTQQVISKELLNSQQVFNHQKNMQKDVLSIIKSKSSSQSSPCKSSGIPPHSPIIPASIQASQVLVKNQAIPANQHQMVHSSGAADQVQSNKDILQNYKQDFDFINSQIEQANGQAALQLSNLNVVQQQHQPSDTHETYKAYNCLDSLIVTESVEAQTTNDVMKDNQTLVEIVENYKKEVEQLQERVLSQQQKIADLTTANSNYLAHIQQLNETINQLSYRLFYRDNSSPISNQIKNTLTSNQQHIDTVTPIRIQDTDKSVSFERLKSQIIKIKEEISKFPNTAVESGRQTSYINQLPNKIDEVLVELVQLEQSQNEERSHQSAYSHQLKLQYEQQMLALQQLADSIDLQDSKPQLTDKLNNSHNNQTVIDQISMKQYSPYVQKQEFINKQIK